MEETKKLLARRDIAVKSLVKSLEYLSREKQFFILTSFMSIEDLEELAKFEARE